MKDIVRDISEITYSRELYDAKPKPFISSFIYILFAIIITTLVWTYFGQIDIVVKGNGIVRPNEKINTIKSTLTGKILKINATEGQVVKAGDLLYTIDHESLILEKDKISEKLKEEKENLDNLIKYKASIEFGENLFAKEPIEDDYYYNKYENYNVNMEYLKYQLNASELQLSQSNLTVITNTQIDMLKNELVLLNLLKTSIEDNTNYLKDNLYFSRFEEYKKNIDKLESDNTIAKRNYDNEVIFEKNGMISKQELENIKKIFDNATLDLEQYKIKFTFSLETDIKNATETLSKREDEYKNAILVAGRLKKAKNFSDASIYKYKLDTLVGLNDKRKESNDNINILENNIDTLNLEIKKAIISTPIDGTVNILSAVAIGDYINIGTELITVIPLEESEYKVQIMLPNKDVASIQKGDIIKFQFHALPYKEYGEFSGNVLNISSDIKTDSSNAGYYLIEAEFKTKEGISYKGEKRCIKVGMTCNAHIIIEQKKILYWLLEKLDLRDY